MFTCEMSRIECCLHFRLGIFKTKFSTNFTKKNHFNLKKSELCYTRFELSCIRTLISYNLQERLFGIREIKTEKITFSLIQGLSFISIKN